MSTSMSQVMPKGISQANLTLRQALRRLWMDHTVYTRLYITSAFANIPDAQAMAERLLRNQDDIGNAVVPFYGNGAGKKLSELLRQHIIIAVDVVSAAKANDKNKLAESDKRWIANADELAAFLSSANPNWPKKDVEDLLHLHLQLIRDFVGEHMANRFPAEIKKLDEYFTEGMLIADTIAEGIIKQFPDKF